MERFLEKVNRRLRVPNRHLTPAALTSHPRPSRLTSHPSFMSHIEEGRGTPSKKRETDKDDAASSKQGYDWRRLASPL